MGQLRVRVRESQSQLLTDVTYRSTMLPGATELDFDEAVAVPAILKILTVARYRAEDFRDAEREYLIGKGFLIDKPAGLGISPTLQKDLGVRLFASLFPQDGGRELFYRARSEPGGGVDLELLTDPNAVVVGQLPWELLYEQDFVVTAGEGTIARTFAYTGRVAKWSLVQFQKLRVLVISPRPSDPALADLDNAEVDALEGEGMEHLDVTRLKPATIDALTDYLDRNGGADGPHVIHFDGHGTYGRFCGNCGWVSPRMTPECTRCHSALEGTPEGYLAWDDGRNRVKFVSAHDLAYQLGIETAERDSCLRLVFLSACRSAVAIGAESEFSGVAQRLIMAAVPSVVAMQYPIESTAAVRFARRFYRNILQDRSLNDAVRRARTDLMMERGTQWYRPVLYLAAASGVSSRFFRRDRPPAPDSPPVDPIAIEPATRGSRVIAGQCRIDGWRSTECAVTKYLLFERPRRPDVVPDRLPRHAVAAGGHGRLQGLARPAARSPLSLQRDRRGARSPGRTISRNDPAV